MGSTPDAGDMFDTKINETGKRYGTWEVGREVEPRWTKAHWELRCVECGHERIIDGSRLRRGVPHCTVCVKNRREARLASHDGRKCGCGKLVDVRTWDGDTPLTYRPSCRRCINKQRTKKLKGNPVDIETQEMLSIGPIVQWLKPYFNTYDYVGLSVLTGVDETVFGRLDKRRVERIHLDTVDKILCALNVPGTLQELYPELYEFTEGQLREAEEWAHGV